jgi:hypothetical protein
MNVKKSNNQKYNAFSQNTKIYHKNQLQISDNI